MNGIQLTSWQALKAGIVSTTKAMLKWLVTNPVGWAILAGGALFGLAKITDALTVSVEEQREKLENLKGEYTEIESELKSLNDELTTTQQRMAELEGKGNLTFTEKEEYDNLVKLNNELQRTIDLLELEQKQKNKEKNKTFVDTMEKDVNDWDEYSEDQTGKYKKGYTHNDEEMGNGARSETDYIEYQFEQRQKLLDDLANAETLAEQKRIQEQIDKIDKYLSDRNEQFKSDADGIEYIQNPTTDDEKAVNAWLDYINDFQDKMAIAMGGNNAKTNAFNRVVDNWQFDDTVQGLQDLGKQGLVTAEMLNDPKYEEFIQKLYELGVIDSVENLDAVALAFNNVGTEAETAGGNVDKMTESIENLNKQIDKIQDVYQTVEAAIKEFNEVGYLSVDTYQSLAEIEAKYIPYLIDEQGNLTLTKDALTELTAARIREMAVKQAEDYIDYIAGLATEEAQIRAVTGAINEETNALEGLIIAKLQAKIEDGLISPEVAEQMIGSLSAIIGMAENAIAGLDMGGLSKNAADNAEKIADIKEDLAEKEKQFAENMAEAWEKEHLEQLKDGLEKQKDIIDRYKKNVEVIDFGLEHIEEDDFANRADLLSDKLDKLKSYGAEMRAEFDRVANTIPQTAEEAVELANRLEELGSDMRDNVSAIRETATALQMLSIDVASTLIDNRMGELQSELDNIDKLIEILNSDYKDDYKYTTEVLSMDMLLPVYSEYDKKRREKQKSDKELIKTEQETQDKINEIVSKSLEMQSKQNAEARAKERKKLIEDMEKARKEAKKKLDEASKDYTSFLNTNETKTSTFVKTVTDMINNMKLKVPEIDASAVDDVINKIRNDFKEKLGFIPFLESPVPGVDLTDVDKSTYGFINPTKGGNITSGYGSRSRFRTANGQWSSSNHQAIDIGGNLGDNIYAIADGTVILSGYVDGYGYTIEIQHADGYVSKYHHMNSKSTLNKGDKVKQGTVIGYIGKTGNSTGPHLDFQITKNGVLVDPTGYIPGYAVGTPKGNSLAANLGIAGENYKPEILIDKATGKATYIDSPTVIDTSTTDVVGEKATARMPKFADGTIHRKVTSGTGVTAEDIDELIKKYCGENSVLKPGMGIYFIEAQNSSGIDALTLFAIAAHESSYGTSQIARDKSNLFGYGAYDADPLNMAYNYGDASNPENLKNGIMSISNLIGKWYVQKRGQDTLYEIEHDPDKTGFRYASDAQWDEKVASYVDKFAKDLEIDLSIDLPPASESDDPGKTDSDNPFSVEHIEAFYTNATDAISRIESKMIVAVQDVLDDSSLSDIDKSVKLAKIKGDAAQEAAGVGAAIYEQLFADYKSWLKAIEDGTATWDLETYEAYRDVFGSISDLTYNMENDAVEAKRDAANLKWENSVNYIDERNEKGDWELYGDSEYEAWQRVVKWLRTEYPNELDKINEAEDKALEARFKQSTNYIDERNQKGDWSLYGDSEYEAWQRVAKWLREEYPDELDKINEADQKAFEARYKQSTDWIDERNTYNDWDLFGDSETEAWERVIKWLKEEYPDELDRIKEAERKHFESRKRDVEKSISDIDDYINERNHYNDWDVYGDSELKAIQRKTEIIKDAYKQRLLSAEEYVDKLKEIRQRIYTSGQDEVDKYLSNVDSYISARNTYNDWDYFDDSEIEAIKVQFQILDEARRLDLISQEKYIEKTKECTQKLYSVAKDDLIETISEMIEEYEERRQDEIDSLNFESSQYDSLKTLLQSYYDVTNAVADAQHEINKELRASQSMYEYLDEDTRELLFNQEDYNTLNEELLDIQAAANELQKQYEEDILGASEETIAEITSQYQIQYETLMKQYEIAKAELDVAKKRQKLDNVLAERNVRMFVNGQWQWVANTQDVIDAENELADAENEKKKAETSLNQTNSINELTTAQDAIATQINYLEADLEEVRNYWADMQELLNGEYTEVTSALRQISKVSSPELKRVLDVTGTDVEGFSSMVSESTTVLSDIVHGDIGLKGASISIGEVIEDLKKYSEALQDMTDEINGVDTNKSKDKNSGSSVKDTIAKMKANSEKWYTASEEERKDLHELNQQLGDSIGADYDEATGKWYSSDGKLLYSTSSPKGSSSSKSSSPSFSGTVVQVGSDGNAPAGTKVGDIVRTAGGDYLVVKNNTKGADYNPATGLWSIKIDEKDADGTRSTHGGLTLMGEEGFEAFITNNGRLIPIAQPTIGNVGAGGIVFNREQMSNLRNLWDLSNLGKISPYVSPSNASKQSTVIDNSIHINGLTVGEQGNEDWINGLRRYVATHK